MRGYNDIFRTGSREYIVYADGIMVYRTGSREYIVYSGGIMVNRKRVESILYMRGV